MLGLGPDLSGDSLTYMAGPRWVRITSGPWSAHLQVLVGGHRLTAERMFPLKKKLLEAGLQKGDPPPAHNDYTQQAESDGFAIATAGGIDYKLNWALAISVMELSYRRSWAGPLWGEAYPNSMKVASGLVLRMGTW